MNPDRHPSDLALESYLLEPATSPLSPHLDACDSCRARIARMETEGQDFRRFVFPATVEKVEDALDRSPRRRLAFFLAPLGGLAAIAATLLIVLPQQRVGEQIKGPAMGLSVYAATDAGPRAIADGERVPPNAALRFEVRPPKAKGKAEAEPCRLWIVSVDASGQVSRIFPAGGDVPPVAMPGELPGGAVLDGTPGPERLFAVCSSEPLPYGQVEAAARAAAGGGADRVRAAKGLDGLPSAASQTTLLLEKRP